MKKNHMLWMIIGCIVPLIIILLLPAFGVKKDFTFFVFVVLMFACHLFMMRGHDHDGGQAEKNKSRGEKHEHH